MTPFYPATLPEISVKEMAEKFGLSDEEAQRQIDRQRADSVWLNETHQVNMHNVGMPFGESQGTVVWLSIKRIDKTAIHDWRELQAIKNAMVGRENEGFEIYPKESRLVDTANQYHLFVFAKRGLTMPVGFNDRLTVDKANGIDGSVQRNILKTTLDRIDAADEALHAIMALIPHDKLDRAFALSDTIKQGLSYYQASAMNMKATES